MKASGPIIHVVDDDASFRTATARLLKAAGYEVAQHESGDQFLRNPPTMVPDAYCLTFRCRA